MTERQSIPRHFIILPALCRRRDEFEFHAITVDVSTEGIRMRSATIPPVAARLRCSIRGVGVMEIRVVRVGLDEFTARVVGLGTLPGEVVRSLVRLARLQAPTPEKVRVYRRIKPKREAVQIALEDGTGASARILNLSASGIALQLDAPLEIGQAIMVGAHRARIVRRIEGGFGAAFFAPLDEAAINEQIVL